VTADRSAARPRSDSRQVEDDWDAHWGSFGDAAAENPANLYRLKLVLKELGYKPGPCRILDVGSGQGELTLAIAARYPELEVKGLEYSHSGVERALATAAKRGINAQFDQRDLMLDGAPDAESGWADIAICSEVLEHLDDPFTFLKNLVTYVRPGGTLIVTVPGGPRSALDRHIGHRRHYDLRSLRELLGRAGLKQISIARAGFPFFDLYRLTVVARGRALIADIDSSLEGRSARQRQAAIRTASRFFAKAFQFNLDDSPFGWQLLARATAPEAPAHSL